MSSLAHRDGRTLFERAWSYGVQSGIIDEERRLSVLKEGTRAIRKIASVLGTEYLRADLERAMRSMLALVNLHLERISGGDISVAARSLANFGLLYHTRGASQALKRVLAVEHGLDPDLPESLNQKGFEARVVTELAELTLPELLARERSADETRQRLAAARALADQLQADIDHRLYEPEQTIMTGLLVLTYAREKAWIGDTPRFEKLLTAVRKAPARFRKLPKGLPANHADAIEAVWSAGVDALLQAIVDPSRPIHQLVAGDPGSNPLHGWLVLPEDTLGEVDGLAESTTAHWARLTRGATTEEHLLVLMLRGVFGFTEKVPFTNKAADTLLRTVLVARPPKGTVEQWLDANAPHQHHRGLLDLWNDFWDEHEVTLDESASGTDYAEFAQTWFPMKAYR